MNYTAMVMPGPGLSLESEERPVPEPSQGQAVVRLRASSLNFHDYVNLSGLISGPWPRVPMTDGCGVVAAVGEDVRNVAVGDRVIIGFYPRWLSGPPTSATSGKGADIVIDVGGPDTLGKAVQAVRIGGYVAIVGVLTGAGMAEIPVATAMPRNVRLEGITVGSVADHVDLCRAMEAREIHPYISHTFGWDEMSEAVRVLQANEHTGKIAITMS